MPLLCHAYGLPVATELEIPGAVSAGPDQREPPAFTVGLGRVGAATKDSGNHLGFAGSPDSPYRLVREGLLFQKQEVARYLCCRGGERLVVEPAPGVAEADVAAYLIATALPALLWMRGEIVLHGAVAVLPGEERAIGFLGASGSGKSRLLIEVAEAGGLIVAEDSFRVWREVSRGGSRVMAAGLPGQIHRRAAGAAPQAERSVWMVPAAQQRVTAGLSALVVLRAEAEREQPATPGGEGFARGPERLHGIAAFEAVLRNRHRPRVPDLLGLSARVLPRCGALAGELPVYSWEFLQAASRYPGKGGTWRMLAGLLQGRVGRERSEVGTA